MPRATRIRFDRRRRRLLGQLAGGAVLATAAPGLTGCLDTVIGPASAAPIAATGSVPPVRPGKVLELSRTLRTTPLEKVFAVVVEQIRDGVSHREVLGATLLAGVSDVKPRPPGTKFHVVLLVASALELGEAAGASELWLPVFFNIHTLKLAQLRDIDEGDWLLPPAPQPLTDDPQRARRALAAALEAWDEKTADRAAVAAARLLDLDDLFEVLYPFGARDFRNIGHKMIHVSQVHRALRMLDGAHREPVVRSLVYGLIGGGPGAATAAFERNRRRIDALPAGWESGRPDPEISGELFRRLRTATPQQIEDEVVKLLERGVATATIWDGLRVAAAEMLFRLHGSTVRNAQLLAVHPLTIVNAFAGASERVATERTRRLLLLQAAAWLPLSRELLRKAKGLSMEGPGFDGLEAPREPVPVDLVVAAAARDHREAAALTLRAAAGRPDAERLIGRCRSLVLRKAPEHHHHKFSAAAFEEFRRADPRWGPYVLAAGLSYHPTSDAEDSAVTRRATSALARLTP